MNRSIFWDTTSCDLVNVKWHFARIYHLHSQGRKVREAKNQHDACSNKSSATWLTLRPWIGGDIFLRNVFDFQHTSWPYVPGDIKFYDSHWDNLNYSRSTVYSCIVGPISQRNCNSRETKLSGRDKILRLCSPTEQEQKPSVDNSFNYYCALSLQVGTHVRQ
jgi:hypothetical protein